MELVSVIVVNHNRAELLRRCLESLLEQTWPNSEILVVDNGSEDESIEVVEGFQSPLIRLIRQERNLGFAAANNLAFREARGDYVALINNDAEAAPNWIESLVGAVRQSPEVGMCASKIILPGGWIDKAGHLIFADGQNRGRGTGQLDRGQYDLPGEVLFPDGCAALYRRQLLSETGGLDEDFFAYADDADLGLRARWLGYRCRYVPEAVVVHQQSATAGLYSSSKIFWVERNRLWLAVKNFPLPLLLLNPFFTLYRWSWNLAAALRGRGAAANFRRQTSWSTAVATLLRAYAGALRGLPSMWRKRKQLQAVRRLSSVDFCLLLVRFRITARELAWQDRPASRDLPEQE